MNKRIYVTPAVETAELYTEDALLTTSGESNPDGFKGGLTEEEGDSEYTRKKGGYFGCPWVEED